MSYRLDEGVLPAPVPSRSRHTPEELFKATYQPKILNDHNKKLPEDEAEEVETKS